MFLQIFVLLLAFACGDEDTEDSVSEPVPVQPENGVEATHRIVQQTLNNPPLNYFDMKSNLPVFLHKPDRQGNLVGYIRGSSINWTKVRAMDADTLKRYFTFWSVMLWTKVDTRPNALLRIIFDCEGMSIRMAISHGSLIVGTLLKVIEGLNALPPALGQKVTEAVMINTPTFMRPILQTVTKVVKQDCQVVVLGEKSSWQPELRQRIAISNIPQEYGGPIASALGTSSIEQQMNKVVLQFLAANTKSKL